MDRQQIEFFMKTLDITEEEAIELIKEDEEVDKMTAKQAENDLTPEQKKAIKKIKGNARSAVNAYGKQVKVNRKADITKENVIAELAKFLNEESEIVSKCEIANKEREINFLIGNDSYTLTLVKHRPPKKK